MKTLVIGLGNPILTDDGAGIYTARAVQNALPDGTDVDVIEVSVGGLTLMEAMIGYEHVILIDTLWSPSERAGDVHVFCFWRSAGNVEYTQHPTMPIYQRRYRSDAPWEHTCRPMTRYKLSPSLPTMSWILANDQHQRLRWRFQQHRKLCCTC